MIKKLIFGLSFLALASAMPIMAQVTIGSGQIPNKGALLDLKEKPDGTSVRGLALPRVKLTSNSDITNGDITGVTAANKDAHIGLVVYNTGSVTGSAATLLCPGLHVWDGDKWSSVVPYPTITPTKTMIGKNITTETSRTDITGTAGYTVGPLNQFTDTRGPGNIETNQYHHARFYAHRVQATGDITYRGIKNTNICDLSQAVVEDWTETGIAFEYVDDGVWMTENLNTEYLTAASPTKMLKSAANSYITPQYFSPTNTGASPTQIIQNGLFYNWAAATNKKGGSTGQLNEDGNLSEPHSLHKERQGICPTGWHLPSDKEWNELEATYAAASSQFTNNATTDFAWLANYNTMQNYRPNSLNVFGHGKSMKSTTPLNGTATTGDSKSANTGGFNLLLVGSAGYGAVQSYGAFGNFWSSSSFGGTSAWARGVGSSAAGVARSAGNRLVLFSVRCKKNS